MPKQFAFIVMSGNLNNTRPDLTCYLERDLRMNNISYLSCKGYYKGECENSVLIPLKIDATLTPYRNLMNKYEQETILLVDVEFQGYLLAPSAQTRLCPLGEWQEIQQSEVQDNKQTGCTEILEWNKVFACK